LRLWRFKKKSRIDHRICAALDKAADLGSGASDPLSNLKSEGHRRQIEDFVKAIQKDKPLMVDGREGRRAVELIEAIYKSASTGKPVNLKTK